MDHVEMSHAVARLQSVISSDVADRRMTRSAGALGPRRHRPGCVRPWGHRHRSARHRAARRGRIYDEARSCALVDCRTLGGAAASRRRVDHRRSRPALAGRLRRKSLLPARPDLFTNGRVVVVQVRLMAEEPVPVVRRRQRVPGPVRQLGVEEDPSVGRMGLDCRCLYP